MVLIRARSLVPWARLWGEDNSESVIMIKQEICPEDICIVGEEGKNICIPICIFLYIFADLQYLHPGLYIFAIFVIFVIFTSRFVFICRFAIFASWFVYICIEGQHQVVRYIGFRLPATKDKKWWWLLWEKKMLIIIMIWKPICFCASKSKPMRYTLIKLIA